MVSAVLLLNGLSIFPDELISDVTNDVEEDIPSQHFVLVHGAWHGSWCWFRLETMLENRGHTVHAVELPAHGIDENTPGTTVLDDYENKVVDYLDSINSKVILVGHSMGGIVISAAAEKRPRKIKKLVYLAAFLLQDGQSLMDLASQDTNSIVPENIVIDREKNIIDINLDAVKEIFYEESSPRWLNLAKALLKTEPMQPFFTQLTLTDSNYGSIRRFYIKTTLDKAVTPQIQNIMTAAMPCEKIYCINSDHSPFFTTPYELRDIILDIAKLP